MGRLGMRRRVLRLGTAAALLAAVFGFGVGSGGWLSWAMGAAALAAGLSALTGYCPGRRLAGRRSCGRC